jgi:hypothetical protein
MNGIAVPSCKLSALMQLLPLLADHSSSSPPARSRPALWPPNSFFRPACPLPTPSIRRPLLTLAEPLPSPPQALVAAMGVRPFPCLNIHVLGASAYEVLPDPSWEELLHLLPPVLLLRVAFVGPELGGLLEQEEQHKVGWLG